MVMMVVHHLVLRMVFVVRADVHHEVSERLLRAVKRIFSHLSHFSQVPTPVTVMVMLVMSVVGVVLMMTGIVRVNEIIAQGATLDAIVYYSVFGSSAGGYDGSVVVVVWTRGEPQQEDDDQHEEAGGAGSRRPAAKDGWLYTHRGNTTGFLWFFMDERRGVVAVRVNEPPLSPRAPRDANPVVHDA